MYANRTYDSVYKQVCPKADNIKDDWQSLISKYNVPLYDLFLIVSDALSEENSSIQPNDVFFQYFDQALSHKGFYLIKYGMTSNKDIGYYLLSDEMENLNRLFVFTETDYQRYKYGNIVDEDSFFSLTNVNEVEPRDTYNEQIKVFRKDGSSLLIDKGATVLDFAFHIHSELGLHFAYAMLDESETPLPIYTRLNEGDMITVVAKPEVEPELIWFRHVKTSKAVDHLIRYFKRMENSQS